MQNILYALYIIKSLYVTMDHKTSHKGQFFFTFGFDLVLILILIAYCKKTMAV